MWVGCMYNIGGGTRGARGAMAPPDFWELKKLPSNEISGSIAIYTFAYDFYMISTIKCTVKAAGKLTFN